MIDPTIASIGYIENLSYIGIFFSVGFSGYIIPIPEEIVLLLGGYLSAVHISNIFLVIVVSFLGAIFGDTLIFYLSGHGSRFTHKYHNRVEQSKLGWYLRHMKEHTAFTIFISRFIVGMRFFNPLIAGLMKVRWHIFVFASALSAAIYIPIMVLVGYIFHHQITKAIHIAESIRHFILIGLALAAIIMIVTFFINLLVPEADI